jgi:HAD superfamily hydrolase (TIGR01490 family)
MAGYNVLYKLNMLTPESLHKLAVEMVVGWPIDEANQLMAEVTERHIRRKVYAGAIERIEWHRAQGHVLAVVTGAPEYGATLLCSLLGIDHVIGTRTPIVNGVVADTFSIDDLCFGEGKVRRVNAFALTHDVDLERSYAYSDSRSDLPLLRSVGHGHAVNPQYLLERQARSAGMPVLRFKELAVLPAK